MKKALQHSIIGLGIAVAAFAGSTATANADPGTISRPASIAEQPNWLVFCEMPWNRFLPECLPWHHHRDDGWHRDFGDHRDPGWHERRGR